MIDSSCRSRNQCYSIWSIPETGLANKEYFQALYQEKEAIYGFPPWNFLIHKLSLLGLDQLPSLIDATNTSQNLHLLLYGVGTASIMNHSLSIAGPSFYSFSDTHSQQEGYHLHIRFLKEKKCTEQSLSIALKLSIFSEI